VEVAVVPVMVVRQQQVDQESLYWQLRYPCKLQAHLEQT
jgi:hypothetical protein